ncbi:plasmid recombination protein, partial [Cronobacter sakazakii]
MSMSVSLKKATNKTNIRHNNRTMSEKEKEQNSHIDYSRSDENKYLVQKDLKKLYREEFGEVLENYNAKQKRNDRKIDDYYKHIQSSKKTSLQQEMIIQVGDKDDFSSKQDFEKANEILEEWLLGFEKRNPNLKIYNAVIHNDEASPHMHLNFVPVASGYKRGLEKQVSFDRAITQQDPTLDKTRPFDDWREKEVKILEEMLKERGIERKLVGSNNYKDVNEYKEKKDLEKEILSLENQLFEKKNELLEMNERLPGEIKIKAEREKKTEVVNKGFLKKEKVEKPTGNWIVETKELKRVQGIINAGYSVKKDYDRLQRMDLVKENKELCDKVDSLAEGYV